jgi:hypothetical protein
MQISFINDIKKIVNNALTVNLVKIGIICSIGYFIYHKLNEEALVLEGFSQSFYILFNNQSIFLFLVILLLMPVNWALEAKKWQLLCSKVLPLSFAEALKGVLLGLSIGFISTPFLGDCLGRIGLLDASERKKLLAPVTLGQLIQFFFSFSGGLVGVYFLLAYHLQIPMNTVWGVLAVMMGVAIFIVVLIFAGNSFLRFDGRTRKNISFIKKYAKSLKLFEARQKGDLFLVSGIRYLVFTVQFFLVFKLLNIDLPVWDIFAGISWIFIAKSLIPVFSFLIDLGVREFSAVVFFSFYPVDMGVVILACLLIWLINKMLPVLVGVLFVQRLRWSF